MAAFHSLLHRKLPREVVNRSGSIIGLPPENVDLPSSVQLQELVETIIPEGDRVDAVKELRKTFYLGDRKQRVRPKKSKRTTTRHGGKARMTSVEKRKIGLFQLRKQNKTFDMFVPIYKIWRDYAEELLSIQHFINSGWKGEYTDKRTETIQNRLKKIDYYGSLMKVTRSRCTSYIGIEGLIIQETKNTFSLIGKDNIVKTIPKLHSEFSFVLNNIGFTILGNHLHQRPVDRAKQNFKKHCLWL